MSYRLTTEKTWSATLDDLAETFRKWGVYTWSVEPTNPGRRAQNRNQSLAERRCVLRYTRKGREVELEMQEQDRAVDNLRVLYLVVEALRMNEARGLAQAAAEAYRQTYPALPAPAQAQAAPTAGSAYQVLYLRPDAPIEVCEAAYKALARRYHADTGGATADTGAMTRINQAIEVIRKEKNPPGA